MSVVDQKRLPVDIFKLDAARIQQGWYSDHYFNNSVSILGALAEQGYRFRGACAALAAQGVDVSRVDVGNVEVDMQYFTRRAPFSLVAGVDEALAMFKLCTGFHDDQGRFINTADNLEIDAVHDGAKVVPWEPVLRVRGRYRDFAILETPTLGALSRRTRIATNVCQALQASGGKPLLFFPARFDIYEAQAGDGYAYRLAVDVWNLERRDTLDAYISTEAQGDWWGGKGSGTMAHAYLLCFLRDTVEATLQFASLLPAEIKRVALVDVNNDCVGDSVQTAVAMFKRYREHVEAGRPEDAERLRPVRRAARYLGRHDRRERGAAGRPHAGLRRESPLGAQHPRGSGYPGGPRRPAVTAGWSVPDVISATSRSWPPAALPRSASGNSRRCGCRWTFTGWARFSLRARTTTSRPTSCA